MGSDVNRAGWSGLEKEVTKDLRCWSVAELQETEAVVWPNDLAERSGRTASVPGGLQEQPARPRVIVFLVPGRQVDDVLRDLTVTGHVGQSAIITEMQLIFVMSGGP